MRGLVALLGGLCLLGFATVEGRGTEALAADAKYAAANATNGSNSSNASKLSEKDFITILRLPRHNMTAEEENCNETSKCHMVCGKGVRYAEEENTTFFCGKIQDVPNERMFPRGPVNPFFCGKIDPSGELPPPPLEAEDEEAEVVGKELRPKRETNPIANATSEQTANGTNMSRSMNVTSKKGNTTTSRVVQVNDTAKSAPVAQNATQNATDNATANVTRNVSNVTVPADAKEEDVESINRQQSSRQRNESTTDDAKNKTLPFSNVTEDKQDKDPDDLTEDRPREDCLRWKAGECAEWKSDKVADIEVKNQSTPLPALLPVKSTKPTPAEKAKRKKWSQSQECHRVCKPEPIPPPAPPPPPPPPTKIVNDELCAARDNCSTCVSKKLFPLEDFPQRCGWCEDTKSCLAGGPEGPLSGKNFGNGSCSNWQPDFCQGESCADIGKTGGCAACTTNPFCGYCKTSKKCIEGDIDGPMLGSCPQWNSEYCEFDDLEEEKKAVSKVLFKTLGGNCKNGTVFINGTCVSIASNATNVTNATVVIKKTSSIDKLKSYLSGKKARKMFVKQINEDNTTEAKLLTVKTDKDGNEVTDVEEASNITHLNVLDPLVRAENRARKANASKTHSNITMNVTGLPKPELTNHPNQTVVTEFKINVNMSTISGENNSAHRKDFEADFVEDLAEALKTRASRFKILEIREGVIQYAVLPAKNWTGTATPLALAIKTRIMMKNPKSALYKGTVTSKVDRAFYPTITPREVPCDDKEAKMSHGEGLVKTTDKAGNEMLHITLKDGTVVEAAEWGIAVAPTEEGAKKQKCRKSNAKAQGEALAHASGLGNAQGEAASLLQTEEMVDC